MEEGKKRKFEERPEEVAGFVRTLYTLLKICDPDVISWTSDGSSVVIGDPGRFASEVCPKFFRHRNFNSFTRILNMYQFHKIPSTEKHDKRVIFVHPYFKRGDDSQLHKIQRKGGKLNEETRAHDTKTKKEIAEKKPEKALLPPEKNGKRAASIFPSEAHYKAAAGSAAALVGRDIWEKTNAEINEMEKKNGFLSTSTVGSSNAVSTWMRRVVELERETKRLKKENARLTNLQGEMVGMRSQLATQSDMIRNLQLQLGSPIDHSIMYAPQDAAAVSAKMTAALLDPPCADAEPKSTEDIFRNMINTTSCDQDALQPIISKFSGPDFFAQQQRLAEAVADNPFMSQCFAHCLSALDQQQQQQQ